MSSRRILLSVLIALTFAATGCSNSDPQPTVDESKPSNDADITFATDMIEHHAQALQMVDMTLAGDLDPQVAALAESSGMPGTMSAKDMESLEAAEGAGSRTNGCP